ncbi:MAG TPA: hypothetical protein VFE58_09020 [Tepidisphaeraceae bacterium]|nr:hypothetical protein [Tepidisphaeraceae bacterium]
MKMKKLAVIACYAVAAACVGEIAADSLVAKSVQIPGSVDDAKSMLPAVGVCTAIGVGAALMFKKSPAKVAMCAAAGAPVVMGAYRWLSMPSSVGIVAGAGSVAAPGTMTPGAVAATPSTN